MLESIGTFKYPGPLLIGFHESSRTWLTTEVAAIGTSAPRTNNAVARHRCGANRSTAAATATTITAFW